LSCKFVIGPAPELGWIASAWREAAPGQQIVEVLLDADDGAVAALAGALAVASAGDSAFLVWGTQQLNMRRLELMGAVKSLGLAMPPLVCRGAVVAASATLSENCYVGPGAVIGADCRIGHNVHIGAAAVIGSGASVGHSAHIDDGAQLGRGVTLAAHVSIGLGVIIAHGVSVGKFSIVDKPGCYRTDVASKTFIHAGHAQAIVVVGQ
jgi:serine acetyltransferase